MAVTLMKFAATPPTLAPHLKSTLPAASNLWTRLLAIPSAPAVVASVGAASPSVPAWSPQRTLPTAELVM
jgi:hypothetical protein